MLTAAAIEAARRVVLAEPDRARWAERLYEHWFHAGEEGLCHYPGEGGYRAAHGAAKGFEAGWRVAKLGENGAIEAERGADRVRVAALDWLPADPARLGAKIGDEVRVRPRIDGMTGGFWHLWSRPWARRTPERMVRVYAPVGPAAAEAFVRAFAEAAPVATRWSMKILCGAHGGGRRDAAVIYLDRRHGIEQRWLSALLARTAPLVAGERLRGTAALAGGLAATGFGWANDPGGGRSFGQWLCERIAAAGDAAAAGDFVATVRASFAAEGGDADAPHLGPG